MSLRSWFERNFPVYEPSRAMSATDLLAPKPKPKPRLVSVTSAPSRDEFSAWRDDPLTQFVMSALARNAEEHRESWANLSWESGVADQDRLMALRERADALTSIVEADYDAFCETLGLDPEPEPQNG